MKVQVVDSWHKKSGEPVCKAHGIPASTSHGRGLRWVVRYRFKGAQRKESFRTKTLADHRASVLAKELATGTFVDYSKLGKTPFAKVAEEYVRAKGAAWRPSTRESVDLSLRLHINPTLGRMPIASIASDDVSDLVRGWSGLAASTQAQHFARLGAVFRFAVDKGFVPQDPTQGVVLAEVLGDRSAVLTAVQIQALADNIAPRWRALILLLAGTGCRLGEALGIEVDHIDFRARTIRIVQQVVTRSGGVGNVVAPPKSRVSYRTIPVGEALLTAIRAHMVAYPTAPCVVRDRTHGREFERKADLVFANSRGNPPRSSNWALIWKAAVKGANEQLRAMGEPLLPHRVSAHSCRKYAASVLLEGGASVKLTATILGHSPAVLLEIYAYLMDRSDDQARTLLDAGLAA